MLKQKEEGQLNEIIEMVNDMTKFDFSKQLKTKATGSPMDLIARSLNKLGKKLERSTAENTFFNGKGKAKINKETSDYKFALDQSSIVAITNTKGDIEYVNEMFCKISKYSEEELIGQNQRIVNSGYHPRDFWKEMWATIGRGKVWRKEVKNKAKDGTYYWVDTTIVPFVNDKGKPERYMAIRHDITEKKLRQVELKRYRKKLEQANENLEKFAYTAAHDMKSPLNSAIGLIDIIEMELKGNENQEVIRYLDLLKDTFNNTRQLISGILEYSKTGFLETELEDVDLYNLITKIANQHNTSKQATGRPIKISIARTMPTVRHYGTALSQIIDNLISNAVKYNNKEICKIDIKCVDRNNHYEVSIADNGPGIDNDDKERIFDLFENLKTQKKNSTGIGLATVKKLITETNGRIWVEASENQGAKFVFTINK